MGQGLAPPSDIRIPIASPDAIVMNEYELYSAEYVSCQTAASDMTPR